MREPKRQNLLELIERLGKAMVLSSQVHPSTKIHKLTMQIYEMAQTAIPLDIGASLATINKDRNTYGQGGAPAQVFAIPEQQQTLREAARELIELRNFDTKREPTWEEIGGAFDNLKTALGREKGGD